MILSGKSALVTGAGGFIGSHLTESLVKKGWKTRAFVHYNALGQKGWLENSGYRNDIEFFAGDITDPECVADAVKGMNVVFYLAALIAIPYSYRAPRSYVKTNIEGTLNVLNAVRDYDIERLIHTSTSEVYGTAQYVPIDEKHPVQAQSPYSASKISADKMVESYCCSYSVPAVIVRPFNTFGPRQSSRAVIPTIIAQCLNDQKSLKLGSLHPTRDMNYISNTVDGFMAAANCADIVGLTINLGSGREISIKELANSIIRLTGSSVSLLCENERVRPCGSEVTRLLAENTVAKEKLNWHPEVSPESGLIATIERMRSNMRMYHPDVYSV